MASAAQTTEPPIILVPGFWLGSWAWDEVAGLLRGRGRDVVALTLPGLDPASADPGSVGLEDHIDAIGEAIGTGPAVLVAHSGAAIPATAALDRHPAAVTHVVWVDTCPASDGAAMNADLEGETFELEAAWDEEFENGSMRDLTDQQLATFRERAVPQPGRTVREPVHLINEARLDVAATLVATSFSAADYRKYAAEGVPFLQGLAEQRALTMVDLPTGHWPMWSKPSELAELIAGVGSVGSEAASR